MLRRLFTVASALSLLLCVAIVVLWVRSYRTTWNWTRWRIEPQVRQYTREGFAISSGRAGFYSDRSTCQRVDDFAAMSGALPNTAVMMDGPERPKRLLGVFPTPFTRWGIEVESYRYATNHLLAFIGDGSRMGGRHSRSGGAYSDDSLRLIFPLWLIALPLFLFGLPSLRHLRRRRRPGYCARCGYDLRASTGCCPECGTPIAAKATT